MARTLVVETEAAPTGPRFEADLGDPAVETNPLGRTWIRSRCVVALVIGRREPVVGQEVLAVHQDQFLMLLLMVDAELDECCDLLGGQSARRLNQLGRGLVDVLAVTADFGRPGAGHHPPPGPGVTIADSLVVAVEQVVEVRVVGLVGAVWGEEEGLEEPGRVGPVPLRGARVRHRLNRLVLGRKRPGQHFRQASRVVEPPCERANIELGLKSRHICVTLGGR